MKAYSQASFQMHVLWGALILVCDPCIELWLIPQNLFIFWLPHSMFLFNPLNNLGKSSLGTYFSHFVEMIMIMPARWLQRELREVTPEKSYSLSYTGEKEEGMGLLVSFHVFVDVTCPL